jgi:hypothetical protein
MQDMSVLLTRVIVLDATYYFAGHHHLLVDDLNVPIWTQLLPGVDAKRFGLFPMGRQIVPTRYISMNAGYVMRITYVNEVMLRSASCTNLVWS